MQVAIILYPGFTSLDVIGPYEVLGRLPDTEVVFVAEHPGLIRNDLKSLSIDVVATLADVATPDVVLIGGGLVKPSRCPTASCTSGYAGSMGPAPGPPPCAPVP